MIYKQALPHNALADSIDCYWSIKGAGKEIHAERIFPDGCPGLVLNIGGKCITSYDFVAFFQTNS
jgi:hypothetical protein